MRKIFIILALLCIFFKISYSHPHLFIDSSIEVVCSSSTVSQIVINWKFDEMFSKSLITDYDLDKDGLFSEEEVEELRMGAFVNLENYEYFAHFMINKERQSVKMVDEFSAFIDGENVRYEFSIPCRTVLSKNSTEFRISFYDVSYFCDIAPMEKESVLVVSADNIDYETSIEKDEKNAFYYGQIVPNEVVVKMRLKNEN